MRDGVSTSATGRGGDIVDAVRDALLMCSTSGTPVVEIAVGGRSMGRDPYTEVMSLVSSHGGELIGHHTLPLQEGAALRPWIDPVGDIAEVVKRYEMKSYTFHPMSREAGWEAFIDGAKRMHEALWANEADGAVETMFTPRSKRDISSGAWWLKDERECVEYCETMRTWGVKAPLLVDLAHVHIEANHGHWRWATLRDLVAEGYVYQIHKSSNDGRRDAHDVLDDDHEIAEVLRGILSECGFEGLVIDEGRAR